MGMKGLPRKAQSITGKKNSPLCETRVSIMNITTWAQGHFIISLLQMTAFCFCFCLTQRPNFFGIAVVTIFKQMQQEDKEGK